MIGGAHAWTNPYITDGLVAMWDGEWNAGGGVHDPNATVWKDLSKNGHDANLISGHAFWGENYLTRPENYTGEAIDKLFFDFSYGGIVSVEFLFYLEKTNTSNNYSMAVNIIGGAGVVETTKLCFNDSVAPRRNIWKLRGGTFGAGNTYGISTYKDFHTEDSFKIVLNGADTLSGFSKGYSGAATIDTSKIACSLLSSQNSNSGIMRLFTARLYSRALTAAEIAANYAIDKQRFNLP
jgi:hypothetical protein